MALSEEAGCALLSQLFCERGYQIERNVLVKEGAFSQCLDGFDFKAKVGFEYITKEANDHESFTGAVLSQLQTFMENEIMYVFVIDESTGVEANDLEEGASAFLDFMDKRKKTTC